MRFSSLFRLPPRHDSGTSLREKAKCRVVNQNPVQIARVSVCLCYRRRGGRKSPRSSVPFTTPLTHRFSLVVPRFLNLRTPIAVRSIITRDAFSARARTKRTIGNSLVQREKASRDDFSFGFFSSVPQSLSESRDGEVNPPYIHSSVLALPMKFSAGSSYSDFP